MWKRKRRLATATITAAASGDLINEGFFSSGYHAISPLTHRDKIYISVYYYFINNKVKKWQFVFVSCTLPSRYGTH